MSTNLNDLISANSYESAFEICPGCENHCTVKLFHFQNGKTFFSGTNCEKVYSNTQQEQRRGTNMFAEKYRMLFGKPEVELPADAPTIGIPRGLGIYENYPFWKTLFSECGFYVLGSKDGETWSLLVGKDGNAQVQNFRNLVMGMNKSRPFKYFMIAFVGGVRSDVAINYIEFIADEAFDNRLR